MVDKIVDFDLALPIKCFKLISEISYYDNNYYEIDDYGDWFYGKLNILKQEYSECENCYTYVLGKMQDNKFVGYVYWNTQTNIFE